MFNDVYLVWIGNLHTSNWYSMCLGPLFLVLRFLSFTLLRNVSMEAFHGETVVVVKHKEIGGSHHCWRWLKKFQIPWLFNTDSHDRLGQPVPILKGSFVNPPKNQSKKVYVFFSLFRTPGVVCCNFSKMNSEVFSLLYEPRNKPSYFPLYWLGNRDPYIGLL